MPSPVVRSVFFVLLALLAGLCPAYGQRIGAEQSTAFVRLITEGLSNKKTESLLDHVWWRNADETARSGLTEAFTELAKYRIHTVNVRGLGQEDRLLDGSDKSVTTDLPVSAVLAIEIAVGDAQEEAVFLFEYPLGQAEGQVWILPVLDRSKR